MCGINGFTFEDESLINKMNETIAHRGPDGTGCFFDDGISLGHNRLSIIDLDARANQPMRSTDGRYEIVFNGEIYNYKELKAELKDYNYNTTSDTEVVLAAFTKWGSECFKKFNGIFAFAIWDKREKELFLARDHFGVKPLFYHAENGKLIFSSEIKAILEHGIEKKINKDALAAYFRLLYANGPETIWQGVCKLPPASFLKYKDGKFKIHKYWQLDDFSDTDMTKSEIKETVRDLFSASVKRQMIADVPVGVFLSGGIDSTAVLAMAKKHSSNRLKTFSVGFEVDKQFERFNHDYNSAKETSKYFDTEHFDIKLTEKDVVDNLEQIVWHMDDLVSNPTQAATMVLAKLASKEVKVVLGGDGGDELFGGYTRYYYYDLVSKWQQIPKTLRDNGLNKKIFGILGKADAYERLNMSTQDLHWSFMARKENLLFSVLKGDMADVGNARKYFERNQNLNLLNTVDESDKLKSLMRLDIDTWLLDFSLVGSDKITMATGLEQRVPFLDKDLAEFAYRIPNKYKIGNVSQGKKIFIDSIAGDIPGFILDKEKAGWFVPIAKWLRRGLKDFAYDILSESYNNGNTNEFIDFKQARLLLDGHIDGGAYALDEIWSLIIFQIWFKKFNN